MINDLLIGESYRTIRKRKKLISYYSLIDNKFEITQLNTHRNAVIIFIVIRKKNDQLILYYDMVCW